jgi:protein required for attachment to host cells
VRFVEPLCTEYLPPEDSDVDQTPAGEGGIHSSEPLALPDLHPSVRELFRPMLRDDGREESLPAPDQGPLTCVPDQDVQFCTLPLVGGGDSAAQPAQATLADLWQTRFGSAVGPLQFQFPETSAVQMPIPPPLRFPYAIPQTIDVTGYLGALAQGQYESLADGQVGEGYGMNDTLAQEYSDVTEPRLAILPAAQEPVQDEQGHLLGGFRLIEWNMSGQVDPQVHPEQGGGDGYLAQGYPPEGFLARMGCGLLQVLQGVGPDTSEIQRELGRAPPVLLPAPGEQFSGPTEAHPAHATKRPLSTSSTESDIPPPKYQEYEASEASEKSAVSGLTPGDGQVRNPQGTEQIAAENWAGQRQQENVAPVYRATRETGQPSRTETRTGPQVATQGTCTDPEKHQIPEEDSDSSLDEDEEPDNMWEDFRREMVKVYHQVQTLVPQVNDQGEGWLEQSRVSTTLTEHLREVQKTAETAQGVAQHATNQSALLENRVRDVERRLEATVAVTNQNAVAYAGGLEKLKQHLPNVLRPQILGDLQAHLNQTLADAVQAEVKRQVTQQVEQYITSEVKRQVTAQVQLFTSQVGNLTERCTRSEVETERDIKEFDVRLRACERSITQVPVGSTTEVKVDRLIPLEAKVHNMERGFHDMEMACASLPNVQRSLQETRTQLHQLVAQSTRYQGGTGRDIVGLAQFVQQLQARLLQAERVVLRLCQTVPKVVSDARLDHQRAQQFGPPLTNPVAQSSVQQFGPPSTIPVAQAGLQSAASMVTPVPRSNPPVVTIAPDPSGTSQPISGEGARTVSSASGRQVYQSVITQPVNQRGGTNEGNTLPVTTEGVAQELFKLLGPRVQVLVEEHQQSAVERVESKCEELSSKLASLAISPPTVKCPPEVSVSTTGTTPGTGLTQGDTLKIPLFVEEETDTPIPGVCAVTRPFVTPTAPSTVRQVVCAPVGTAAPAAVPNTNPGLGNILMGPVGVTLSQISSKFEAFNDQPEKWISFKTNWQNFLRQQAAGGALPDSLKLELLRHYGGTTTAHEVQRRFDLGQVVTYSSVWSWLCSRFDSDVHSQARDEWRKLAPEYKGKLDVTAWRRYESEFRLAWTRVQNGSDTEAYDAVMRHLPASLRESVTIEEEKRDASTPAVKIGNIGGLTLEQVAGLVQVYTGQPPHSYRMLPSGEVLVQLTSREGVETLLSHQGQRLTTGEVLRIQPDKQKMHWVEVFGWIERRLRGQATSDQYGKEFNQWRSTEKPLRQDNKGNNSQDIWSDVDRGSERRFRGRRRTHAVTVSDIDTSSDDASVSHVRSRSAPVRPKGDGAAKPKGKSKGKSKGKGKAPGNQDKPKEEEAPPVPKTSNQVPPAKGGKGEKGSKGGRSKGSSPPDQATTNRGRGKPPTPGCWHCGAEDHWRRECPYAGSPGIDHKGVVYTVGKPRVHRGRKSWGLPERNR